MNDTPKTLCDNCPIRCRCLSIYKGKACTHQRKELGYTAKETNYMRIINMSVDEMTVWLDDLTCNCASGDCDHCKMAPLTKPCRPSDIHDLLEKEAD